MQTIFTSTVPFESERVHTVAIYCSDGRYGDQVDEFLHRHLGLPNYDRMTVAGGPAWLSLRSSASLSQHWLMREQIDFLVHAHCLHRVVLIAHYGCAFYLRHHFGDAERVLPLQIEDLREAARTLHNWFTTLQIESYFCRAEQGRVLFQSLPERFNG